MNLETVHYLNIFLGFGAILLQIVSLVTLALLFFGPKENKYLSFIKDRYLIFGFLLSLAAAFFSLFYSEVLNYAPCYHCWIQRVFMYPQVFIFAVAYFRRDLSAKWYSLPLLLAGLIDALYLNYIYYFNPSSDPCDASGISCVQRMVNEFSGYISIPTLSITIFLSLITVLLVAFLYKKDRV